MSMQKTKNYLSIEKIVNFLVDDLNELGFDLAFA